MRRADGWMDGVVVVVVVETSRGEEGVGGI